jgi:transmembrane sensor
MEPLNAHRQEELLVAERAADWLRRLKSADAAERAAFMAWLKESPRHVREILLATTWDKVLDSLGDSGPADLEELASKTGADVIPLNPTSDVVRGETPPRRAATVRGFRKAGLAAAATVLMGFAIWASLKVLGDDAYTTAIGEQRVFALRDGSMVYLNAHSQLTADFSDQARDVHLLDGQAIFKVKHDAARPFRVHVNGAVIQAIGTQFDVQRLTDRTSVSVIEGKVRISAVEKTATAAKSTPTAKTASLVAGETASITSSGNVTLPSVVNVADATAWQQRRLVFRKRSLADMVLEFNRYNRVPQIRIESEVLRERQFNGVFDADDPESLVRFLEAAEDIAVDRDGGEIVIRARK